MSHLRKIAREYLAVRRALGHRLVAFDAQLERFISFLESKGAPFITVPLALEWAQQQQPTNVTMKTLTRRLDIVRGFARYLSAIDPRTQIPATALLPHDECRAKPYIYSEEEILRLMEAAKALPSPQGIRNQTYYCLIGLLAVTGLRVGEALKLRRQDVDLGQGVLAIHNSKFGKSRLVPLHPTTAEVLAAYARRRDAFVGNAPVAGFFVTEPHKTSPTSGPVRSMFAKLSRKIGLRDPQQRRGPRLHDLRHRFAVHTLLAWYRRGEDVERRLPALSTFLGHEKIQNTYWYLSSTPELLGAASKRLEKRWEGQR